MTVFDNKKLFDKDKVEKSLASTVWETPPEVFDPINREFKFTLDVCADRNNTKCELFYDEQTNGLIQDWSDNVCWCNPPYGNDVRKWVKKAIIESEKGVTTVLLIPCKTNTNWWHDLVIPKAEVRFLRGRVKFIKDSIQTKQALPWPLAFVIYRANKQEGLI